MNKAIVITYTGSEITDLQRASIENIVSAACDNVHDLIVTTTFDNNDIAKALLAYGTKNATIRFEEQSKHDELAEAIQKAVYFINEKYGTTGGNLLMERDYAMAKYHATVNSTDEEEQALLNAVDILSEVSFKDAKHMSIPQLKLQLGRCIVKLKNM
jgi:dTDP-glucose pyrophosphorylase